MYATPPSDQAGLVVSVDLGWTFVHRSRIWTLFGDSWPLDLPTDGTAPDDALGYMSLADFPDGASVEAFVAAHPAPTGDPAWHAAAPPLHYVLEEGGRTASFAPMRLERDGMLLSSGTGFVPSTGFSNGRDDERAGAFAIITRYAPVECDAGSCDDGFDCDTGLGRDSFEQWNPACVVGERRTCVAGPGFCLDRGNSRYDETSMGRIDSVVSRFEVGVMNEADPAHFRTQPWDTRRFYNLTSRSVSDFDASRAGGHGNDYRPAHGNSLPRSGLFIWGRPQFGGIAADARDAKLYLAWVPMPAPDAQGRFDWQPRYFAGLDADGKPRFVERQVDSQPLDLDVAADGDQPEEVHDVVAQMAITWLPNLQRFVMFYGGEMPPEFLNGVFHADVDKVKHNPRGSLHVRFAEQPWGPWTAPREFLPAGEVSDRAAAEGLYAAGGILAHNDCSGATCARYEPTFRFLPGNNNGVLYGPNFVDPWTVERAGHIDFFWFVSTWNPYQVVLMKTTMTMPSASR